MCRELKNKPGLEAALKKSYSSAFEAYTDTENENDFRDLLEPPQILREVLFLFGSVKFVFFLLTPSFTYSSDQISIDDNSAGFCRIQS